MVLGTTDPSLTDVLGQRLNAVMATCSVVDEEFARDEVARQLGQDQVDHWVTAGDLPRHWRPADESSRAAYLEMAKDTTTARLACVELAVLAVAETGSLITVGPRETRRLAMLADVHVLLVRESDVVATLDDAASRISSLEPSPPYLSFVTGASRTSDIERTLAIGVHGPSLVRVMVLHA